MKVVKIPVMCPRCQASLIPNNEFAGKYPGALSRVDNKTEICSACGADEAMTQWMDGYLAPIENWPVSLSPTTTALLADAKEEMN
jgi:ribosomal protein S27AE